ncbi:MAG TPA: hypothetical protein VMB21_04035 [Candidatus Limnocylindria bacterium]|nr:hypothetical protein [Candidatus Limnocylindria bacterium]
MAAAKDEEAMRLAQAHYQVEAGLTHVFRIAQRVEVETLPGEPIKLLEVNENTVPSGVLPLRFDPAPEQGFHYPAVIVEVTPDEFRRIDARELKLPEGWTLGDLIQRPAGHVKRPEYR